MILGPRLTLVSLGPGALAPEWRTRMAKQNDKNVHREGAEQAFESFREAIRAIATGGTLDPEEAIQAYNETLSLAMALGREERRERFYEAIITYGKGKVAKLGPTSDRGRADGLAKAWLVTHANVGMKGDDVLTVKLQPVEDEEDSSS